MIGILAPPSFLKRNRLSILQVIVINKKYATVLGLSSKEEFEVVQECIERFGLSIDTPIVIQNPSRVLPAKRLIVSVQDPVDERVVQLLESSLIYRLQGLHILIGSCEKLRILGNFVTILYAGADNVQSVPASVLNESSLATVKIEPNSESSVNEDENNNWIIQFDSTAFSKEVFKIGPSTKLNLQFNKLHPATNATEALNPLMQRDSMKKDETPLRLYGLQGISNTLVDCLKDFALATLQTTESIPHLEVENGILLYGLPGCGKRSLVNSIAERTHRGLVDMEWCDSLVFISITSEIIRKLCAGMESMMTDTVVTWLSSQMAPKMLNPVTPVVLIWPNMDHSLSNQSNTTTGEPEDDRDNQGSSQTSAKFSLFVQNLIEAFSQLSRGVPNKSICRFFMLATAENVDTVFNFSDCRKLFYRRLLVSLPNAECRFQILKQQLEFRVSNHRFVKHIDDLIDEDSLVYVASKLHGYTPRDLVRLAQVSYAAFVSELSSNTHSPDKTAGVNHKFYEILMHQSKSYLPINLSQHMTHFEPLHWTDIGGYDKLKSLFQNVIENRLVHAAKPDSPEARADANLCLRVPRGILLHGPPGCSKTMFVRALATECLLPLIAVQASRIFGRYVGDSERNMRRILVQARASAPAILFIDEIDLLLPSRSSSETGASEHVLSEVLTAMDGVEGQSGQIILIGATNRMDKLDSALRRAGRFDLVIEVPAPDQTSRADILRIELSKRTHDDPCLLQSKWLLEFSKRYLKNFTGAEVVRLVEQAAQLAREDQSNQIGIRHLQGAVNYCPPSTLTNYDTQFAIPKALTNKPKCSNSTSMMSCMLIIYFISTLIVFVAFFLHSYYLN